MNNIVKIKFFLPLYLACGLVGAVVVALSPVSVEAAYVSGAAEATSSLVSLEGVYQEKDESFRPANALVSREAEGENSDFILHPEADPGKGVLVSWESPAPGKYVVRAKGRVPDTQDMTLVEVFRKENIKTVDDYSAWLAKNFIYRKDASKDTWAMPVATLAMGGGDCEDLAFLNAAAMKVLGYTPKVFALIDGFVVSSHAICVFEADGYTGVFDNTKFIKTRPRPAVDIVDTIVAKTTYFDAYEIVLSPKNPSALGLAGEK